MLISGSRFFTLDEDGRAKRVRVIHESHTRISGISRRLRERAIARAVRDGTLDVLERNPLDPRSEMLAIRTTLVLALALVVGMVTWIVVMLTKILGSLGPGAAQIWVIILFCFALNIGSAVHAFWPAFKSLRRTIPRSIRYTSPGVIVTLHDGREASDAWEGLKLVEGRALRLDDERTRREVRIGAVGRVIALIAIGIQTGETRKQRRSAWRRKVWRVWLMMPLACAALLGVMGGLHALGVPVQPSAPWAAVGMFLGIPAIIEAAQWISRRAPRLRRRWRRWWMSGRPQRD